VKIPLVLFALVFIFKFSFAQRNDLAVAVLYEIPQGDLGTIYSPGPLYQVSYSSISKFKKKWNSLGFNLGYLLMSPQKPVFDYFVAVDNVVSVGKATYSDYKSYQFLVDIKRGRFISKGVDFFWGCDAGYNFTQYEYALKSAASSTEGGADVTRYILAPKLGFIFTLSKSIRLNTQTRYLFSIGQNDNESSILNQYFSIGTGLSYRF
jgi:hypothetical protein